MPASDGTLCPKVLNSRTERHWLSLKFNFNINPHQRVHTSLLRSHLRTIDNSHHGRHVHHRRAASRLSRRASPPPPNHTRSTLNSRVAITSSRLLTRILSTARHGHSRHHVRRRCIGNGRENQSERARPTDQCYEHRRGEVHTVGGLSPAPITDERKGGERGC